MLEGQDGGADALGLLTDSFMGGSPLPSLQGGDAGPAISEANSNSNGVFSNPFSVSGQGGNASTVPLNSGMDTNDILLLGMAALVLYLIVRK